MNNKSLVQQCENSLDSVLELALKILETLKFDRKDAQQLYAVCLYARILELAYGCKAMMDSNTLVGIPVLLRSMFEADIDLVNVLKHADYPKQMQAAFVEQKIRLTKNAIASESSQYFAEMYKNLDLSNELKKAKLELKKLNPNENLCSIKGRAEFAGKLEEYLSVYNMLCLDTHNNIRSLEQWHLNVISMDEYHAEIFKTSKDEILHCLSTIPGILLLQSKAMAEFIGVKGVDFEPCFKEFRAMQSSVVAHTKDDNS